MYISLFMIESTKLKPAFIKHLLSMYHSSRALDFLK